MNEHARAIPAAEPIAAERATGEAAPRPRQLQEAIDWDALWRMIDARIREFIASQGDFPEFQREVLGAVLSEASDDANAEITKAIDGLRRVFDARLEAIERRAREPGTLPVAKAWRTETVYYEGQVVTHDGALYQARRDTGQAPSHADWQCLARAGRDGDGFVIRGTYNAESAYRRFDVVALGGGSFVAIKDAPGACPGPDWQLVASAGKRGDKGAPGLKGDKGAQGATEPPVTIRSWSLDVEGYKARPVLSNGQVAAELDLRPMLASFAAELSAAPAQSRARLTAR